MSSIGRAKYVAVSPNAPLEVRKVVRQVNSAIREFDRRKPITQPTSIPDNSARPPAENFPGRVIYVNGQFQYSDGSNWNVISFGASTGFATPTVAFGTAYAAGVATTAMRSDATLKYPTSLMSTASSTLMTLTDGATNQTLTFGVGDMSVQLASGGGIILKGDITTGPLSIMNVQMRPGTGVINGIQSSITAAGAVTSSTVAAWNANQAYGSATFTTATLAAYRIQAISAQPNASSDANNKLYGFLGATPSINATNGGWLEVASALFPGPSRAAGSPTISGISAGIITEPSTVGATSQAGIYIRQRTAQVTAANRYGIYMDAQNSGTSRRALAANNSLESLTDDFISSGTSKGFIGQYSDQAGRYFRLRALFNGGAPALTIDDVGTALPTT